MVKRMDYSNGEEIGLSLKMKIWIKYEGADNGFSLRVNQSG